MQQTLKYLEVLKLMLEFAGCIGVGQNCYVDWFVGMAFGGDIKCTQVGVRRENEQANFKDIEIKMNLRCHWLIIQINMFHRQFELKYYSPNEQH